MNEFIDDMALFVKDIEKKLLPEPEIIFRYKPENSFSQSSQTNSDNVMEMVNNNDNNINYNNSNNNSYNNNSNNNSNNNNNTVLVQ